jgi:hypothetical protein
MVEQCLPATKYLIFTFDEHGIYNTKTIHKHGSNK